MTNSIRYTGLNTGDIRTMLTELFGPDDSGAWDLKTVGDGTISIGHGAGNSLVSPGQTIWVKKTSILVEL